MKMTGCVWPGGIKSVPSSACLWSAVDILLAWTATRFPPTPLITGWNTVRFSKRDTINSNMRPPQLWKIFAFIDFSLSLLFLYFNSSTWVLPLPADQHGNHDWRPAEVENIVGVLVLLGDPYPERRHKDVTCYDEGCCPVLLVYAFVKYGGDPWEECQRCDVAKTGSYRRGHVVRIDMAMTGEDDDARGDKSQNERSEGRGDQTAGA